MSTRRERVRFENEDGDELSGLLELPAGSPTGFALFAHCFTCGKDIRSASRMAATLAQEGIATLRFDFTGLGSSDGDFANTNFRSNVEDLVSAAEYMDREWQAPSLLIGHSLGGAAVLAVADRLPSVRAVVTIGAPSDPGHVAHLLDDAVGELETTGEAQVSLAGRPFRIKKQFLEDIREASLERHIGRLRRPLLIFHSPVDEFVSIDEAARIYGLARHPKSFISLDDADHLLSRDADAAYVGDTLAAWVKRYLGVPAGDAAGALNHSEPGIVRVDESDRQFTRHVVTDDHDWLADEPEDKGGRNLGPDPYEHLLAALGTCTSMTVRMYANHKQWPLEDISVSLSHDREHCDDCAAAGTKTDSKGRIDVLRRRIRLTGKDLSQEQRERLLEIADRCPVHRTLSNHIRIDTTE